MYYELLEELLQQHLKRFQYLILCLPLLTQGDRFFVQAFRRAIEFKVIKIEPSDHCIVAPETEIICDGEPIKREEELFELQDEVRIIVEIRL